MTLSASVYRAGRPESKIPAAQAGSYLALIPVVALASAWLWLNEVPTLISSVGCAIVFSGVLLVDRRS